MCILWLTSVGIWCYLMVGCAQSLKYLQDDLQNAFLIVHDIDIYEKEEIKEIFIGYYGTLKF